MDASDWTKREHVERYLARADTFPHKAEGEGVLLDQVPLDARRVLDLGTGDGRLLALLRADRPESKGVALDVSEPMLERAGRRFASAPVELIHPPTTRLHRRFYEALGYPSDWEDPSNRLADVETQFRWLREIGFEESTATGNRSEMALLIGIKSER